ncbi:hypothetical protein [Brevibacillus panacihumi]|uniref:hypothetical protein n=1 Tax=Brevibacillus panacihumi TaxID=497735 RepID=UPI003D222F52
MIPKPLDRDEQLAWQRECIMEDYHDQMGNVDRDYQTPVAPRRIVGQAGRETPQQSVQPAARTAAQAKTGRLYA